MRSYSNQNLIVIRGHRFSQGDLIIGALILFFLHIVCWPVFPIAHSTIEHILIGFDSHLYQAGLRKENVFYQNEKPHDGLLEAKFTMLASDCMFMHF